jgi:hypothetical protein
MDKPQRVKSWSWIAAVISLLFIPSRDARPFSEITHLAGLELLRHRDNDALNQAGCFVGRPHHGIFPSYSGSPWLFQVR